MTIRELTEPLFLYICQLNRSSRKGGSFDIREVRGRIQGILGEMQSNADANGLGGEYEKIELALIFFVDSMIAESNLAFAAEWHENRLAFDRNELAGDEKFFDILEETLEDPRGSAVDRLAVLYTCLGLGFTGWYAGDPEYIHSKMLQCATRMRDAMDQNEMERVCQEAYEHVDDRDLIQPPGSKLALIAVMVLGLVIALFIMGSVLYWQERQALVDALNTIEHPEQEEEGS